MNGMVTQHFDLVMERLPLMLQAALLLFSYVLSNYLFFINEVVASVLIGFTLFGLLFYLIIVSTAIFSHYCPFQASPPSSFSFLTCFDNDHEKYLERTGRWLKRLFSQRKKNGRDQSLLVVLGACPGSERSQEATALIMSSYPWPTLPRH